MVSVDERMEMTERPVRLDNELLQAIILNELESYVPRYGKMADEDLMFMPESAGGNRRDYTNFQYH